jgi:hypothetical protein
VELADLAWKNAAIRRAAEFIRTTITIAVLVLSMVDCRGSSDDWPPPIIVREDDPGRAGEISSGR